MANLVQPHGSPKLKQLLLSGQEKNDELKKAEGLPKVVMTSRETSDLIMMGIGAFTPLDGFMTQADWKGVCAEFKMANGIFWPIPITLSTSSDVAGSLKQGAEIALVDEETDAIMATMKVTEKYQIDKEYECKQVFTTNDTEHPGVQKVIAQKDWNLAGPVKVLSESYYPEEFKGVYQRPTESRKIFEENGWKTVAALQLRNPMHRSHEYLAKIAIEVCDGLYIHQLVGKLKAGDIPADVRVKCINTLVENYFVKGTVVCGGYPMEMRYAGPREALLHAVFRQNYGCSHLIVGRDHAGVGDYYGPFDAQKIFHEIPIDALETKPLPIDWTF
ncbi:MAG: sulfate adenylyltransferase, partial [bacterium]